MKTYYGKKLGQTSKYDSDGMRVPVTLVSAWPGKVVRSGIMEINFGLNKITRKMDSEEKNVGEEIKISDIFNSGDIIKVAGTTIGKGFQGVIRRHGFKGGPMTHGATSTKQRHGGSIGQTTTPGRVYKGKRMAGHMGVETVTVKNLKVFAVSDEEKLLEIQGLVPGSKGGLLKITKLS